MSIPPRTDIEKSSIGNSPSAIAWPHLLVIAVYLGASALHKELPAIDVGIQHLLSCPLKILVRKDASTDGESCLAIHLEMRLAAKSLCALRSRKAVWSSDQGSDQTGSVGLGTVSPRDIATPFLSAKGVACVTNIPLENSSHLLERETPTHNVNNNTVQPSL